MSDKINQKAVNHFKKKYIEAKNVVPKTGPWIRWMKEKENDTKLALCKYDFTNGIPTWSRVFNDLENGIVCLAGLPNHGKSSTIVNLMEHSLELNPDLMVLDISLDDDYVKRRQQFVACISGLAYQEISTFDPDMSEYKIKAKEDADALIESFIDDDRLRIYEAQETIMEEDGKRTYYMRDFKTIWQTMATTRKQYPNRKIVMFIDSWNNLKFEGVNGASELATVNELLEMTKEHAKQQGIIVFLSAHLRKTQGRRPTIEDIKGTSDMAYTALWAGVIRNEFKEGAGRNPLMYEKSGYKFPLVVIEQFKNKVSTWDLPLMFGLDSQRCQLMPLNRAEYERKYIEWLGKLREKK